MAEKRIIGRAVQKHDIESNWLKASNFIPMQGEIIVYDRDDNVTDESLKGTYSYERFKIGDGATNVNALPFVDDALRVALESLINDVDDKVDAISALVGDTSVSDQISNAISEIPEQVQSDWNQNDDTAADYVKNRPFYVGDAVEQSIIESQTIEGFSDGYVSDAVEFVLIDGANYVVMWDGVRYECTASIVSRDVYIGNPNLWDSRQESNNIPFVMVFENGGSMGSNGYYLLSTDTTATYHTISLSVITPEIVKIDEKYLPDVVAERGSHATSVVLSDFNATASAPYAFASGPACQATGNASHAGGRRTVASGDDSRSEGYETIAAGENQYVEGKYNIEDTTSTYAHIVGNGSSLARSNAHTLDWSGNAWFAGDIRVGGTSYDDAISLLPKSTSVTLSAASWTGDANPWSQVITVSGVTANSKVDFQPTAVQIVELQNADIAFMAENNDGVITAYAIGGKPESDYTMQVLITEVIPV